MELESKVYLCHFPQLDEQSNANGDFDHKVGIIVADVEQHDQLTKAIEQYSTNWQTFKQTKL